MKNPFYIDRRLQYRDISIKMLSVVLIILSIILSRSLLNTEGNISHLIVIGMLIAVSIVAFFLKWTYPSRAIIVGLMVMFVGKVYYLYTLYPVIGPDGVRYYAQISSYDMSSFLSFFWESLRNDHILMSAYPAFGIAYLPFYYLFNTDNVYLIVVLNTISLVGIVFVGYRITEKYFYDRLKNNKTLLTMIAIGVLCSPSYMYWTSTFSKDVFSLFIAFLALYALLEKRFLLFLLLTAYATMLRPYSIAIIAIYFILYKGYFKLSLLMLLGSLGIVWYSTGFVGVTNALYSTLYLVLAPFPLNLENWSLYFLPVAEVMLFSAFLLVSLYVFINNKKTRKFYMIALIGLVIYACVMALIGNAHITSRNLDYGFGTIGDNITRKKLPLIFMFYTVIAYTVVNLPRRKRS